MLTGVYGLMVEYSTLIFGKTSYQGAQTIIHAAVAPVPKSKFAGKFLADCRIGFTAENRQSRDQAMCDELWKETAFLLKLQTN